MAALPEHVRSKVEHFLQAADADLRAVQRLLPSTHPLAAGLITIRSTVALAIESIEPKDEGEPQ